tara:strand:- start:917 stop:1876 length:960 start_codon:yes stop_codon:yes gene_type:complete
MPLPHSYQATKTAVSPSLSLALAGVFMLKAAEYESRGSTMTFCEEDMPYYRRRIMLEINSRRLLDGSSAEVPDGAFEDALAMEEPDESEQSEQLGKQSDEQLAQQLQEAEKGEQEKEDAEVSRQVAMQVELEQELEDALRWGRTDQVQFLLEILDASAQPITWVKELQELTERMAREAPENEVHDETGDGSCYFYAEQRALQHLGFAPKTSAERNFETAALAEKRKTLEEVRKRAGDKLDGETTLAQEIALTQPKPGGGGFVDITDAAAVQAALQKCVFAFTTALPPPPQPTLFTVHSPAMAGTYVSFPWSVGGQIQSS